MTAIPPNSEIPPSSRGERIGDRGGVSIFTVIITLVVVVFLGGIVDFEQKLEARHDANIIAQEAARAGAGQVDRDRAYTRGQFTVDRNAAVQASIAYLRASGQTGSVTPVGTRGIRVSVVIERPAIFLTLIGTSTLRVRGEATADLVTGVEAEQ